MQTGHSCLCAARGRILGCPVSSSLQKTGTFTGAPAVLQRWHTWQAHSSRSTNTNVFQASRRDPGDWAFSPEWMGTQAGGWGRNAGEILFEEASLVGNGQVQVTSHEASWQCAQLDDRDASQTSYEEWRVLRFSEETRQSVVRVKVSLHESGNITVAQQPNCLAFLYTKTVAAAVASLVGLAPTSSNLKAASLPQPQQAAASERQMCRVLCVGLGGGSVPYFLTHHFAGMEVEVVELDPVVIRAASDVLGLPLHSPRLTVHEADAIAWVGQTLKIRGPGCFDIVFLDAFDSENEVPSALTTPGSQFLEDLAAAVHPEYGVVLTNLHTSELPSLPVRLLSQLRGGWQDPYVVPKAQALRDALLEGYQGCAYTLGVGKQYNAIVVVARGSHLAEAKALPAKLRDAALLVSKQVGFSFPAAARAALDFKLVH